MKSIQWAKLRHFTRSEFTCNCCGVEDMNNEFMEALDELRERCGFPFVVTSGYRCSTHNQRISTTGPRGPHTTGKAVDIKAHGGDARRIVQLATENSIGMSGIGLSQRGHHLNRFIHLDSLGSDLELGRQRPWIWTY